MGNCIFFSSDLSQKQVIQISISVRGVQVTHVKRLLPVLKELVATRVGVIHDEIIEPAYHPNRTLNHNLEGRET